jgi:hypothetical protein
MRFYWIDVARLFFAFLVVTVHVPLLGGGIIHPIACLAVPFFYVTTGFFVWHDDELKFNTQLRKSFKNYVSLYGVYFLAISAICWCLKLIYHNEFDFSVGNLLDLFWTYGNSSLVDAVDVNGRHFGISTLWFLYGGILSIGILFVCRRHLFKHWFKFLIIFIWVAYAVINTERQTVYLPRTIGASLPYLYAGIMLRRGLNSIDISKPKLLLILVLLVICLYVEEYLFHPIGYARVMLLPTIIVLFYALTKLKGGSFIKKIPIRTSFDIYVWHRFLYIVSSGILGLYLYKLDSILIYFIIFICSLFIRRLLHDKSNKTNVLCKQI